MKQNYVKPKTIIVQLDCQVALLNGSDIQGDINDVDIQLPSETTSGSMIEDESNIW